MATIERKEKVKIVYDGKAITLKGDTFDVSVAIDTSGLASIYMSGSGEAEAKVSIDVADAPSTGEAVAAPVPKRKRKVKTLDEVKAEQVPHRYDTDG